MGWSERTRQAPSVTIDVLVPCSTASAKAITQGSSMIWAELGSTATVAMVLTPRVSVTLAVAGVALAAATAKQNTFQRMSP